jgi:hypothetical protein
VKAKEQIAARRIMDKAKPWRRTSPEKDVNFFMRRFGSGRGGVKHRINCFENSLAIQFAFFIGRFVAGWLSFHKKMNYQ